MFKRTFKHMTKCFRALICAYALFATGCSNGLTDFLAEEKPVTATAQAGNPAHTVTVCLSVRGAFAANSRSVRPNAEMARYELWGALAGGTAARLASFTSLTGASVNLAAGTWNFTLKGFKTADAAAPVLTGSIADKVLASDPVSLAFVLAPAATGKGNIAITLTWPEGRNVSAVYWSTDDDSGSLTIDGNGGKLELADVDAGSMFYTFTVKDNNDATIAVYCEQVTVAAGMTSSKTVALTEADLNSKPAAPSNLQAALAPNLTDESVTVNFTWADNSDNETEFHILRSTDGGATFATEYTWVPGGTTSANMTGLTRGTGYCFRASASNNLGESTYSNVVGPVTVPNLVKFDLAGGNISGATSVTAQEIAPNGTVALPADPVKAGSEFGGWYSAANGGGTRYTATTPITANVTLYALFGAKVTYDANGGSGAAVPVDTKVYKSTETVTLAARPAALKKTQDGIELLFTGWNTKADGTGTMYKVTDTPSLTENTTLYASWSIYGATGPAGGLIFYDNGSVHADGWRYMEAWTADESGLYKFQTDTTVTGGTLETVGTGYANTYTCLTGSSHPAAEAARNASHGGKTDWFLPSNNELYEMKSGLYAKGFGSFTVFPGSTDWTTVYWSSSEFSNSGAYVMCFGGSGPALNSKTTESRVRLARRF